MKRSLAAILFVAFSTSALAQMSPVGVWKTIDDETKKEKSLVRIKETNGVFTGTIEKFLDPATKLDEVCDKCSDDRKGKPITGMEIIRGMRADGANKWSGGSILKPDEGKVYKSKMELIEGGRKLQVSGCIAFICKSQVWERM